MIGWYAVCGFGLINRQPVNVWAARFEEFWTDICYIEMHLMTPHWTSMIEGCHSQCCMWEPRIRPRTYDWNPTREIWVESV